VRKFDFTFLRNSFDGEKLIVLDWRALMERECSVTAEEYLHNEAVIYGDHGFFPRNREERHKARALVIRAEKYAKRSFKVNLQYPDRTVVYDRDPDHEFAAVVPFSA